MVLPHSFGAFAFPQQGDIHDFANMQDYTGPDAAADTRNAVTIPYAVESTAFYIFTPMPFSTATQEAMPSPAICVESDLTVAKETPQRISFTELPAEIRNHVYYLTLVSSRPLKLKIKATPVHKLKSPVEPSRIRATGNVQFLTYRPRNAITGGLLLANHQVSAEAKAVVYGANKYIFEEDHILTRFTGQIGFSIKLIRHLRLNDVEFERHGMSHIFSKFGRMGALKMLELPRLMFEWFTVDSLVELFESLGRDGEKEALEVRFVALTWEDGVGVWVDRMDPKEIVAKVQILREQVWGVNVLDT